MFATLAQVQDIISDISGRQRPKVKKYLDGITRTSVLEDLNRELSLQLKGWKWNEILRATFDRHCIEGASQQKYWNGESFRNHIRSTSPITAISDPTIQLLWRSFSYYAYHPLSQQEREIDFNAFKRAAILLVFQCDDLIGTQELDSNNWPWLWRNDASCFRTARFERIFRSIGTPSGINIPLAETRVDFVLSDAMDVLSIISPEFVHLGPTPEQLETVSRKLLDGVVIQREVRREELSTLVGLLIRMRVIKEKWGPCGRYYNHGNFAQAGPADAELTEILVNSLAGDKYQEEPITSERLLRAMDLMPNLHLRFYQLWTILFQPPIITIDDESSQILDTISTNGAVLLFAPQIKPEYRYTKTTAQKTEQIAITSTQASSDTQDMAVCRLARGLSGPSSGYVVLFNGIQDSSTGKAVVGVYFPGPLFVIDSSGNAKKITGKGGTGDKYPTYLLFQLQPRFRLLRGDFTIPLPNIVHAKDPAMTLEDAYVTTDRSREVRNMSYRIGKPNRGEERNSGLDVDPEARKVRLVSGGGLWFGEGDGKNWEVVVKDCKMDILAVSGGLVREMKDGEIERAGEVRKVDKDKCGEFVGVSREVDGGMVGNEDVLKTRYEGTRIVGEELTKRIQGFGSRNL